MNKEKSVYIVILNWRNVLDTLECLESLQKVRYPNFRIILVNNDKDDFSEELLEKFNNVDVINNHENFGFAKGNNIGIKKAIEDKADYILVLNNDTVVESNFLQCMVDCCNKKPKTIVGSVLSLYKSEVIENAGGMFILWLGICKLIKKKQNKAPDYLSGACFLVKREYFQDIGLFDEDYFTYFEDTDWSLRARKKGYSLKISSGSIIWHKHSASTKVGKGWGPIKAFYIARNTILFAKKNFKGLKKFFWIFIYLTVGSNLHLFLYCRNLKTLQNHYKGVLSGFK